MKVDPAGAGFDERRLERITEHLQHRYIDAGRIAGCQVAVARHGHVGYFRSFGFRGSRAVAAGRGGHDLAHLLDDQADHRRRADVAVRARRCSSSATR